VEQKTKKWVPVVRWVARIWSLGPVIMALVVIVFSRSEEGVVVLWTEWAALSLVAVSVIGLALAWRWQRLGGWISLGALVVFLIVFLITVERSFPTWLIFLVGIGVPAVLFLISAYGDNNRRQPTANG
jgi:hypothetical protein